MGKILCATRGGAESYRTQDAVIELAKAQDDDVIFLYVVDLDFLDYTAHAVRPDVVAKEMAGLGEFLLAMAAEKAAAQGIEAKTVVKNGRLADALRETALEEDVTLVACGCPTGSSSRFREDALERLLASITAETGIETRVIQLATGMAASSARDR